MLPEKLSVLLAHNYYRERGGEDIVFERETELLRSQGHRVAVFTCSSAKPAGWRQLAAVVAAGAGLYNLGAAHQFRKLLRRFRPDLVHVHNTFPVLSPSILSVCREAGVPVVATLHNYRLLCPAATLCRKGQICQDCRARGRWHSVARGCYRNSRALSAAVCLALNVHERLRTWQRSVRVFIVPSGFTRKQFLAAGWPAQRVWIKAHFVLPDPGPGSGRGRFCLFVGRLAPEKGVQTLLRAWEKTRCSWSLKIVGDGPMAKEVASAAARDPRIEWLGAQTSPQVMELLGRAEALLVPSECLETFGLVVIEAFARAVPVIASSAGALSELVRDGETGMVISPGDSSALSGAIETLAGGQRRDAMGRRARLEFERRYSAEQNYLLMRELYRHALGAASAAADLEER